MKPPELTNPSDPYEISDYLLERTREAYLQGDFNLFASYFFLPLVVGTFEGEREIRTGKELNELFDSMGTVIRNLGMIDMKRKTIEARFLDADTINATFITELVLAGYKVSDEVVGNVVLIRVNDEWKVRQGRYATNLDAVSRTIIKG